MKAIIKSYFLTVLFLVAFILFVRLGFWQLDRADQKNTINSEYVKRQAEEIIENESLISEEFLWRKFIISGKFIEPNIFLDNQMNYRTAGYVILTPYKTINNKIILINRGWHPLPELRNQIPRIEKNIDKKLVGVLTPIPAHGIVLGGNNYEEINSQSIRIQRVDLDELISKLNIEKFDLYPFMLTLTDPIDKNLTSNLILPVSDSEKNYGYAFQWFAFALTLLIIFVVLRKKKK